MTHPQADWAERIILGMNEYIVPIKRLWYMHCEEHEVPQVTPEELSSILKSDTRFHYIEEIQQDWEDTEEEVIRLERMGFFKGPKVMLQGRIPSKQQLIDSITNNIEKMMVNLRKAYEIRPKDNDQTEDELIDVMLKADQLRKEILKAMSDEVPSEDAINKPAQKEGSVGQE